MYHIEGSIRLISDCLFNKPSEAALLSLESGQRGKKKTVEQKIEAVADMVHRNGDGKTIVLPGDSFKLSYLEGSKFAGLKMGKRSLYPTLNALTFPEDLSFGVSKPDYIHEHHGRVPPRTGGLVMIRRPAFKMGRELNFKMLVADDVIEADQIKIAIEHGGLLVGIGSWRPKYGRYQLGKWKVTTK